MDMDKVLVVAENPFSLALMSDLLEANGLRTIRARSSREAIECAERLLPDLVVVDVALSGNGSKVVLDRLKTRPRTRDIPVLAVGDRNQAAEAQRILDKRFAARMEKPISTTRFARSVVRAVRSRPQAVPAPR